MFVVVQCVLVVVTPGTKVCRLLLSPVPRCVECCYARYQVVLIVITPGTKVC